MVCRETCQQVRDRLKNIRNWILKRNKGHFLTKVTFVDGDKKAVYLTHLST